MVPHGDNRCSERKREEREKRAVFDKVEEGREGKTIESDKAGSSVSGEAWRRGERLWSEVKDGEKATERY